jgi:hypothetical protein
MEGLLMRDMREFLSVIHAQPGAELDLVDVLRRDGKGLRVVVQEWTDEDGIVRDRYFVPGEADEN